MNRSAERRQYKRFWVLQPAVLKNSWAGSFPCAINDFCPKGVLISLPDSSTFPASIPELQDQAVTIEFRPDLAGADLYRLSGRVVRVTQNSLGIAVENFPINAFLDLTRVAEESAQTATPSPAHTLPQSQVDVAKARCHEQFIAFIKPVIQDFYKNLEDKLIQAAYQSSDFVENRRISALYPLISSRRAEIEQTFTVASYLQQIFDQRPASVDQYKSERLSLVDIDDFEDWLNLSQVINELGFEHQSAIENFEIRYKVLASSAATAHDNPYGPYFIFQTFRKTLSDIDLEYKIRAVLYKVFFESLARFFADFYQGLNETVAFVPAVRNPKATAVQDSGISQKTKDTDARPDQGGPTPTPGRDSEPPSFPRTPAAASDYSGNDQLEYKLDNLLQYLGNPKTEFRAPIDHLVFRGQAGLARFVLPPGQAA